MAAARPCSSADYVLCPESHGRPAAAPAIFTCRLLNTNQLRTLKTRSSITVQMQLSLCLLSIWFAIVPSFAALGQTGMRGASSRAAGAAVVGVLVRSQRSPMHPSVPCRLCAMSIYWLVPLFVWGAVCFAAQASPTLSWSDYTATQSGGQVGTQSHWPDGLDSPLRCPAQAHSVFTTSILSCTGGDQWCR